MKTWPLILTLLTLSSSAWAHGPRHPSDFEERIRSLELSVRELQNELDRLREQRPAFSCLLNTPFGTFHGKGETMLEAKARTLNACEKGSKAFCHEDKVVCEKADF
ncbi:MAG TPA: hypothetical protein VE954_29780 [Oligoflexus sp.]|uniref:hypothetical protein n=1 Tax=Oligoflexus sp. TaxID=1971216 RepID=UPI002D594EE3|nr:hypothetical protein [Oligoflexus sp.]HYX37315.1 hypothetical protein [Oligoflexus sp.]